MELPQYVHRCIDALEYAGFEAYAVGGCVRDHLLGLQPHDYALCTAALPEQIQAVFAGENLVLAGLKHGTVGVVTEGGVVEITTFRTEGSYQDSRHPDWVKFVPEIREDLARRDFTVNAMAYSPTRGYADPFGGQEDLHRGILRAVGHAPTRFSEDALRILRGVRFAARFRLVPEASTLDAMVQLCPTLDKLARERVVLLISHHMTALLPDRKLLRRRLSQFGQEAVLQLLALQRADFGGKGVWGETADFDEVEAMLHRLIAEDACLQVKDLALNGRDLMALGFPAGPQLGQCLNCLLEQVLEETLPNERSALLAHAAKILQKNRGNRL